MSKTQMLENKKLNLGEGVKETQNCKFCGGEIKMTGWRKRYQMTSKLISPLTNSSIKRICRKANVKYTRKGDSIYVSPLDIDRLFKFVGESK